MINIDKSYIEIFGGKDAANIDIRSVLKTEKQNFYLLKECRSEVNTRKPFSELNNRFEWLPIVDDNEIYTFSEGVMHRDKNDKHNKHLIQSEIKYLSFDETLEHVSAKKNNKIYNVNEFRDFIHIDDVCKSLEIILIKKVTQPVNVSSGKKINLIDVCKKINKFFIKKKSLIFDKKKGKDLFSNNNLLKKLGMTKFKNIDQIIKEFRY